jgi:short subunit dehydrogenase-like uncharacterized protein
MSWIIYGATGYTGKLMAAEAARRGLQPVLAGRDQAAVSAVAETLGLEWKAFGLGDGRDIREGIRGAKLVLHCAGPFSQTARPMIDACLAEGVHYLDVTGEIDVFQFAHARAEEARRADVVLIPGVGFDVVPSDCLAASLVEALPAATELQLAFESTGGASPGTAKTSVEGLGKGGRIRRDGRLETVPLAWKTRTIPFAHAERTAVTIPWGDVYTAYVSTGVPDIEVYMSLPSATIAWLRRLRWMQALLGSGPVQAFLKGRVESRLRGPSEDVRQRSYCELWGQAKSADGRSISATMSTPNGYDLTVSAGLGIVEYLLAHSVEGGYYTPSLLMGSGYAATLPGVTFNMSKP